MVRLFIMISLLATTLGAFTLLSSEEEEVVVQETGEPSAARTADEQVKPSDPAGTSDPADIPLDSRAVPDPAVLQDILDVRRRRGSVIEGTLLDQENADPSTDFEQALHRVGGGRAEIPSADSPPPTDLAPSTREPEHPLARSRSGGYPSGGDPLASPMLSMAMRLEWRAGQLDLEAEDGRADRLRRIARLLRREARSMR